MSETTTAEIERLQAALRIAVQEFEAIRLILVGKFDEPERSAFWKAVSARDAARALLGDKP